MNPLLNKRLSQSTAKGANPDVAKQLLGKVAIANAKMAYLKFREICASPRWKALEEKGAQKQRLLWASTGTKNPTYRDTLYVEELIGPETVNTIPPATLGAFRDHGRVRASLEENIDHAGDVIDGLEKFGISLKEVTDQLLHDGVASFAKEFEKLLSAVDLHAKGRSLLKCLPHPGNPHVLRPMKMGRTPHRDTRCERLFFQAMNKLFHYRK
jgi:transaldolase / glucose-6-phosphate isomerase